MEGRNKIYGRHILEAFRLFNIEREVESLILNDQKEINEFLYEHYKGKEDIFAKNFKPEWDRSYPFFNNFRSCLFVDSDPVFHSHIISDVRRLHPLGFEGLKKLDEDSCEHCLAMGIGLDRNFGCDEKGNRDFRTRIKKIHVSDLFYQGSVYDTVQLLIKKKDLA